MPVYVFVCVGVCVCACEHKNQIKISYWNVNIYPQELRLNWVPGVGEVRVLWSATPKKKRQHKVKIKKMKKMENFGIEVKQASSSKLTATQMLCCRW